MFTAYDTFIQMAPAALAQSIYADTDPDQAPLSSLGLVLSKLASPMA